MLSFMLFISGMMELYFLRKYDHLQEMREASLALIARLKEAKTPEEKQAAIKASSVVPTIASSYDYALLHG